VTANLEPTRTPTRPALTSALVLLVGLALVDVVGHLLVGGNYGYFRDELYYIAAGHHLSFGYVDFPPLIALLAALLDRLAGDGLVAIHVVPAIASGVLVIVAGLMAWELGGGRATVLLAGLGTAVAVVFLATGSIFSMDVLDQVWWALAAYLVIRRIRRDDPRIWLLIGLVVGAALATKLTVLFFCFGLVVGLFLTPLRRDLRTPWPWLGGVLAAAFLAPYVVWNAVHGWATPDFWSHSGAMGGGGPISFLANQILSLNPITLPLTVAGLLFLFRSQAGKPYRALGWAFVVLYVLFTVLNAKPYYLAPAYPMLFAAGACLLDRVRRRWILPAYGAVLAVSGALLAPLAMPVLPPATFVRYYGALSGAGNGGAGQSTSGAFPQYLGDRFGWDGMASTVSRVYTSLPAAERAQACVFTGNYGEASALSLYRQRYSLPPVISGHNSYYLWGPGPCSGQVLIVLGQSRADLQQSFGSVEQAATITCSYCMPEENDLPVYVARQPVGSVGSLWPTTRHYN